MGFEPSDPARDLERVRGVLAGVAMLGELPSTAKMLSIILGAELGCDVEINRSGFYVRHAGRACASSYYTRLAAPTLHRILRHAGVRTGEMPLRFRLDPGEPREAPLLAKRGPRWIWIASDECTVRIQVRPAGDGGAPPTEPSPLPAPRPTKGPLRAHLPIELDCPRCTASASVFRMVEAMFVCGSCGRSFVPGAELVKRARITSDGDEP